MTLLKGTTMQYWYIDIRPIEACVFGNTAKMPPQPNQWLTVY